ncbi:carbonic anhydrase 4 isoform X2 [Carettochelys insculpta]|uniref:carbonic anhydrase 4 isoform X2 n=1 Tax=Carettochelys insculpta TaxID=44489 RepID=UPI003EBF70B8
MHLATGEKEWCYLSQKSTLSDCEEPRHWDKVNEECGKDNQSPINIVTHKAEFKEDLKPFTFEGYDTKESSSWTIANNGHTVKVSLSGSAKIGNGGLGNKYKAIEFHFHWGNELGKSPGSEHSIDGERYAMELHIVHTKEDASTRADDKDRLAVLAFFIQVGAENQKYGPLIEKLKDVAHKGNKTGMDALPLGSLIPPKDKLGGYYRYSGSLTTPSCNETVVWTIFKESITLGENQVKNFWKNLYFTKDETLLMTDNFRPVQPLNGRVVYSFGVSVIQPPTKALLVVLTLMYLMRLLCP